MAVLLQTALVVFFFFLIYTVINFYLPIRNFFFECVLSVNLVLKLTAAEVTAKPIRINPHWKKISLGKTSQSKHGFKKIFSYSVLAFGIHIFVKFFTLCVHWTFGNIFSVFSVYHFNLIKWIQLAVGISGFSHITSDQNFIVRKHLWEWVLSLVNLLLYHTLVLL